MKRKNNKAEEEGLYLTGVNVGESGTPATITEAELNDGRAEEDEHRTARADHLSLSLVLFSLSPDEAEEKA